MKVLIGRFQTPLLTKEVRNFIEGVRAGSSRFAIIIGVSKLPGTKLNPLDFESRRSMLAEAFPGTTVLPIQDHPLDDVWSTNLDRLIRDNFQVEEVTIFGSEDNVVPRYSGVFYVVATGKSFRYDHGGLQIDSNSDFRKGVVHAYHKLYPKVYPTVDIAVFRGNKKEMLLGFKEIDKKWRFPGGFTDPTDAGFEGAALRELKEECGDITVNQLQYEKSFLVDDWRYRYEEDKIITTLFSADLLSGDPIASDDIAQIKWVPLEEVRQMQQENKLANEHQPLFDFILNKYGRER